MTFGGAAFLFVASVLAGAVNSVAGGGTLLSFPAAIAAGLPPIVANATNAVAMVPGSLAAAWAYSRHLKGLGWWTAALAIPGMAGAAIGAAVLRKTPQRLFDGIVPWLVLGATVIIFIQGLRAPATPPGANKGAPSLVASTPPISSRRRVSWPLLLGLQLLVSIYGGYFGAAMGIVMLAFLTSLGPGTRPDGQGPLNLHQMNAVKNVLAVVINGTASIDFIIHGLVRPGPAVLMAGGAIAGGVMGGRLGRRARPARVRRLVVGIGFAMTALLAWRRYG